MNTYYVQYRIGGAYSPVSGINIVAPNKETAYELATFIKIPEIEGELPYSSWVTGVTYDNGIYRKL